MDLLEGLDLLEVKVKVEEVCGKTVDPVNLEQEPCSAQRFSSAQGMIRLRIRSSCQVILLTSDEPKLEIMRFALPWTAGQ
ncbi:hypothetical protein Tco_0669957 [Tanacetum coccineum]